MAKQSKITVKHYLEKKLKPIFIKAENTDAYPLYYRITYKRKTTNLRSFTAVYMTENALKEFTETGNIINLKNIRPFGFDRFLLINELKYIETALKNIIKNNENIEIFDENLIDNLKHYFLNLKDSLFYLGWSSFKHSIDVENINNNLIFENKYSKFKNENNHYKNQFYGIFNKQNSLLLNLFIVKKVTGYDLEPFIHIDTLKFWYVINLILIAHTDWENNIFIDFFINYDLDKLVLINNNQKYLVDKGEIDFICKALINKHLKRFVNE